MPRANFSSLKSKYFYLASFLTPAAILFLIMLISGVYPFGDNCILKTDMYHQYAPFLSEFREKLQNGGSLKFSWNVGLGVNFTATMAYYLASPSNLLLLFVGENHVLEFISISVTIKCGLAAAAMALYLKKRCGSGFGAYIFSVFYALSGYFCAYYWNIMWLDSWAVFPLVMLGAERLLSGKGGAGYAAALGYSIFTNYYISIPVCIFLFVYFFAYNALNGFGGFKGFLKKAARFAFWSLAAAGTAAVLLLPEICALKYTASSDITFPKKISEYFPIIDMLARHMAGVQTEQWLEHSPNIYCGSAVYLLFCLYFSNRKISLKEKIVYTGLALFMLTGFSVNILNFIWHGLRYPNSLPARQSFIYCFLVIFMCCRVYEKRDFIRKKEITTALAVSAAFILICQKLVTGEQFHFLVFYAALLLTVCYAGLLHLYRSGRFKETTLAGLAVALATVELAANTAYTSFTTTSRSAYLNNNDEIREVLSGLDDTDFYRVERKVRKTKDDGAWLNFPSVSLFSSMANADCTSFFKKVGCEASTNAYSITGSTPLIDMLLSVKYAIYNSEQPETNGLSLAGSAGETYLYKNRFTLSLGFALPRSLSEEWMLELDDPVLVQNTLCDLLGVGQVLTPSFYGEESGGQYTISIDREGEYYAFIKNKKAETVTVNWPDRKKTFENVDRGYLIELGNCERGELITMSSEGGAVMDAEVYRFDYDILSEIYEKLSKYELQVTDHGDDFIIATVNADSSALGYSSGNSVILMSTPYDSGWKVTVDGKETETFKGLGTFLSFSVGDGEHEIRMEYEPDGLRYGAAVSAVSVCVILAAAASARYRKRRKQGTKSASRPLNPPAPSHEQNNDTVNFD